MKLRVLTPQLSPSICDNGDKGDSEDEESFLPQSIFDESESKGPEVAKTLASRVNESFTSKPLEGKLKPLMDNYKSPVNCEMLCVPRVNSILWNELPKRAHQIDLGLQEAQKAIMKTAQAEEFVFFTAPEPQFCVGKDAGKPEPRLVETIQQEIQSVKSEVNNVSSTSHSISPVGNVANRVDQWSKITSDKWVLETIQGYHLEFGRTPWQKFIPGRFNLSESKILLINAEVVKLLEKRAVVQASVSTLINFLTSMCDDGKAYSTINTYRSAVSTTLEAVTGINIGSHPLVTRFMKDGQIVFVINERVKTSRPGKAHSHRSAVTSEAFFKGASVADIMKLADWSVHI
ncbi:predicted protein [Nematostella vectensis]|uniref:Uncharacterized protein n=1 Tax=Nematostella vectensis TaxID=45351 RepID=A7S1S1_NEMVE|nr:predicted protein [Nematostella vectensis]|eukprot:XP_001634430.1 predicted protein [Nematostella vectensis]